MLTLVNTESGNFNSIINAFNHIGAKIHTTNNAQEINNASALILPGVAAFANGMNSLKKNNLVDIIKDKVQKDNTPIIGICLGMQLLGNSSNEHGEHTGLGLINSQITKLTTTSEEYRIPNIGWSNVIPQKESILFPNTQENHSFYHVHSFHMQCNNKDDIAATIEYDNQDITVAIEHNNIFGVQFHPEKSQDAGLNLLERFLTHTKNS